jgi:DNA-binding Lrp family transcriptional regulator
LLALDPDFRKSFRTIAKVLGVSIDTVRNRVKRLEKIGFILGWNVLLNPSIVGQKESAVWFDVPPSVSKNDLIEELKLLPGVFVITSFYDTLLFVFFRHEDSQPSLQRRIRLIEKLSKTETLTSVYVPWPVVRTKMHRTDWNIIRALRHDPRRSQARISGELGISTRTVERRLRRMLKDTAIYNLPTYDFAALKGTVIAGLTVGLVPPDTSELIRRITVKLDEYLWYFFPVIPHHDPKLVYCLICLAFPNVTRAREIVGWVKAQKGVVSARMDFADEQITLVENLDYEMIGKAQLFRKQPSEEG